MTDIAAIILTKDEKLHIERCLEQIAALSPRQVFVVDCFSTDGTQRIVEEWNSGAAERRGQNSEERRMDGERAEGENRGVTASAQDGEERRRSKGL